MDRSGRVHGVKLKPTRRRLALEVLGAGVIGLAPLVCKALLPLAPGLLGSALVVAMFVTGPALCVTQVLVLFVGGYFTTDTVSLDRIGLTVGVPLNAVALPVLWLMVRTGSRESMRWKLPVALMTVWFVVAFLFGVFASMWR